MYILYVFLFCVHHIFFLDNGVRSPRKKVYRALLQMKTTTNDSLEGYEHYRSFMDKLAESGVDDYVDLPMIAVMGDTSSGKSSLLSNISLVELPSPCSICLHGGGASNDIQMAFNFLLTLLRWY